LVAQKSEYLGEAGIVRCVGTDDYMSTLGRGHTVVIPPTYTDAKQMSACLLPLAVLVGCGNALSTSW
jgi:hypothetical protein